MRSRSAFLCLLLLCCCAFLAAAGQSVQHQQWTTEDGLPQDSVHQIFQSGEGFLWIATEGGVARFDGLSFLVLSRSSQPAFSSNDVCCIAETADGTMWFGTSDGVVEWRSGRAEHVTGVQGQVLALAASGDELLALTPEGVWRERRGTKPQPMNVQDVTALGSGNNGTALLVAAGRLLRYRAGASVPVVAGDLPPQVEGLVERGDTLWLRTRTTVVARAANGRQRQWSTGHDLPGSRVESISADGETALVGTNRGAVRLNATSGMAEKVSQLGTPAVLSSLVDSEGDRWFGTETSGLHVLRDRSVGTVDGLADEVLTSIAQAPDGTVWLGTRDDGLRTVRGGVVSTPAASAQLTSQVILSLAVAPEGDVWVGTPDGLNHLRGTGMDRMTAGQALPDDFIRSVLAERGGELWVGTRRGLAHLRGGRVDRVYDAADGLRSELVGSILRAYNCDLWFATLDGLARLRDGHVRVFGGADGLPGATITALAQTADGTLWVGTRQGGLAAAAPEALAGEPHFRAYRDAALQDELDAIVPDAQGGLWLRTPKGLLRADLPALLHCGGKAACAEGMRSFGVADGMPSVETSGAGHPVAAALSDGQLWFATRKGVAVVDPAHLPQHRFAPPVALEQFSLDGREQPLEGTLQVPPGRHRYQFVYAGLSFAAPARVSYRYRLEGYDAEWTEAGSRRIAEYTSLPPGHYRFVVEARSAAGDSSARAATLDFVVAPPFYRHWWFALLVLLGAGAVVYAVYQLRLRRVRREFDAVLAERNRIAREIHDTLAQDFVGVSLQLEITAQLLKLQAVDAAREQVDATRALVKDGIRDARESIWALRAEAAAGTLPARLREVVERARRPGLEVKLSVRGVYRALPAHTEQELLRIAKEALQNVNKHAVATEVETELLYEEEVISIAVCDNGRGFDPGAAAQLAGHYGMRGMRERAEGIGAKISVTSSAGKGTRVAVRLEARGHGEQR